MPRPWTWPDGVGRDIRSGARALRRNPAFTSVAIVTLGLGIGASTAIFSVVNAVLLRPLPYEHPDRQVQIQVSVEARNGSVESRPLRLPLLETEELLRRTRAFDTLGNIGISLTSWRGHEPRWSGSTVTASVLAALGVRPVVGRLFTPSDELDSAPGALILSFEAWRRHFAGDPGVLGQVIVLEPALGPVTPGSAASLTVVGVLPAGFHDPSNRDAQYWVALRRSAGGAVVGRLAEGTSAAAAAVDIEPVVRELYGRRSGPRALGFSVMGLQQQLVAPVKPALLLLMGAVGFVLLIACVNVANLLVARAVARQREMGIRAAIGAGQWRIFRLMLIENLLLTGIAATLGTLVAVAGVGLLRRLAVTMNRIDLGQGGSIIPRMDGVSVDGGVLIFTAAIATATGLLFGTLAAIQHRGLHPMAALRAVPGSVGVSAGRSRTLSFRTVLILGEIALSIMLLVGGLLLIRSFVGLLRVDVGYDPEQVLTFQVALPSERYPVSKLTGFAEAFVSQVGSHPGVVGAAYANQLPLVQLRDTLPLGRVPHANGQPASAGADVRIVGRSYFSTMRILLVAGRLLGDGDAAGQPPVLVVNETLARREFGSSVAAIGQQVYLGRSSTPWLVVGVVADVRQVGLETPAAPQFFVDARQWREDLPPLFPLGPYYTVRFTGDDTAATLTVRAALARAEPEGVLFNIASMDQVISTTVVRPRMYAVLLASFAGIGMILALVGIYGVVSYTVSQRTRELGIRLALGARREAVLTLVLRESLILTAVGITLGLLGAAALTRTLEALLFDVTPLDPATFATVALLFAACAGLAAYLPARRATRVDPIIALRTE